MIYYIIVIGGKIAAIQPKTIPECWSAGCSKNWYLSPYLIFHLQDILSQRLWCFAQNQAEKMWFCLPYLKNQNTCQELHFFFRNFNHPNGAENEAQKGGRKSRCWSDGKMAENKLLKKMSHLKKWTEMTWEHVCGPKWRILSQVTSTLFSFVSSGDLPFWQAGHTDVELRASRRSESRPVSKLPLCSFLLTTDICPCNVS